MKQETDRDAMRRDFFDKLASGWEERNYSAELRQQTAEMVAGLGIAEGIAILDVGCGQGILLPYLRQLTGESGRLIALDASAAMLEAISEKDAKALAIHASAERIPLIDNYVDMVICFSAFPHFSDKLAAAKEFHRVLKPGGKTHVLHIGGREFINRLHDMYEAVEGDHLPEENGMRALFAKAGFSSIALDESDTHYYFSAIK